MQNERILHNFMKILLDVNIIFTQIASSKFEREL